MTSAISHAQGELLAQVHPGVTTAVTLFQSQDLRTEITLIAAAIREGGGATKVLIYHDDNGTTYNDTTLISGETPVEDDADFIFQAQHPGSGIHIKPGGSLGVKVDKANEITFSVYGVTETLAERVRGAL